MASVDVNFPCKSWLHERSNSVALYRYKKRRFESIMGHTSLEQGAVQNEGPLKIPVSERWGLNLIHPCQGCCNSQLCLGQLKEADATQHRADTKSCFLLPNGLEIWGGEKTGDTQREWRKEGWAGYSGGCRWWGELTWLHGVADLDNACVLQSPRDLFFILARHEKLSPRHGNVFMFTKPSTKPKIPCYYYLLLLLYRLILRDIRKREQINTI